MPILHGNSAEATWAKKPVLARRLLDDKSDTSAWLFSGTAAFSFRSDSARSLRADMQMFAGSPAPTRNRLSSVNLRRLFPNEDWSAYNRLLIWLKADFNTVPRPADGSGFPVIPFQLVLHSEGKDTTPDRYGREGIHYFSVMKPGVWQPIYWEIDPLHRDRVSSIEIGYWVNKMLAHPSDRVAFEIGDIELQRVEPDEHTGWTVGRDRIAASPYYQAGTTKTALANGLNARDFNVFARAEHAPLAEGVPVLRARMRNDRSRLGDFQVLDFSSVDKPGVYVIRAGNAVSRPIIVGTEASAWHATISATLNFFYGNRCGFHVPGVHNEDHRDWFATLGDQKVSMSGGWHDAGDLSQGIINTGEATYAMFELAERVGRNDPLRDRLIEEARWGLDWIMRVRLPGGYKVYFSSHNLWTDNVVGNADDRSREMKNNPNANYIAAAAEARAHRALKESDPELAARALALAKEDWEYAIAGKDDASTRTTPAFTASDMELSGIGITASIELFKATQEPKYASKAVELAKVILESQQRDPVGTGRWNGFFYTSPGRDTLFHQFHRGNDQAPIVALVQLLEAFPQHRDATRWREAVKLHLDFQKRGAATTAPWNVLPAYVYRTADAAKEVPDSGALHGATRTAYVEQVKAGTPLGGDWYLRTFPVWFARRGNYGVLLSQTKALSVAGRHFSDSAALDLAHQQLQWVLGRNPFTQSTMYGVGFDWAQQYSVSSGDFVGTLPVGIQSRGASDLPYWPGNNMYVWKEVWVHPSARWLWILADLLPQ